MIIETAERKRKKGVSKMTVAAILDDAMYKGQELIVKTKSCGEIRGTPYVVDMYDSDPDRLGYCLEIGNDMIDTVFLDEVVSISEIKPIKISPVPKSEAV